MTSLYNQRTAFERQVLAELGTLLRGSPWKKKKNAMFGRFGDYYQDVMISVHRNSEQTTATLRCKPLAVDTLLWDILDIPENHGEPLSFRTWGAFTCSGLPLIKGALEAQGQSPRDVAANALEFGAANRGLLEERLKSASYSKLLASHPHQIARGAYAVTLVTSLINDGNDEEARRLASAYASGALTSTAGFISAGMSFHEHALKWLDAGRHLQATLLVWRWPRRCG